MSTDKVTDTIQAVKSIIPLLGKGDATSENKANYLAFRFAGFSVREAADLAGIHQATVMRWRDSNTQWFDEEFVELEAECSGEKRVAIRREVIHLQFTRNFLLMMKRDADLLMRSVKDQESMTDRDWRYLEKARAQYTPSQFETLERLLATATGSEDSDTFEELVLRATQEYHYAVRGKGGQFAKLQTQDTNGKAWSAENIQGWPEVPETNNASDPGGREAKCIEGQYVESRDAGPEVLDQEETEMSPWPEVEP